MALTTQTSNKITENVVTDLRPEQDLDKLDKALESPNTVRRRNSEAEVLFNKALIARPLVTPNVADIEIKNNEYRYRWVNRLAQNGMMYQQRLAQGFLNATTDDVVLLAGDAVADKGEIRSGDIILMKIQADRYDGAIKYNMLKAHTLQRARGVYLDEGKSNDVYSDAKPSRKTISAEPFSRASRRGAANFIPENADAIVEDSIKTGRVAKTRETVAQLREQGK